MSRGYSDIGDDEIRVISSETKARPQKRRLTLYVVLSAVVALIVICAVAIALLSAGDEIEEELQLPAAPQLTMKEQPQADSSTEVRAYASVRDTVVGGVELSIFTPRNATPVLEVGGSAIADSTAVLVAQAADIRGDNGDIVGTFVVAGELLGKGESKAGFCSIVNGEITLGVADATPMLEQALTTDGYFFRQYPLVAGGQIVENKPKGKSIRKALAEIDGGISVIVSHRRLSFHDFSQALTDAGVRNAIYLVGSKSQGLYVDAEGRRSFFGNVSDSDIENINYIVWR